MKIRKISFLLTICLAMTMCTGCLGKKDKDDVKEKAKEEAQKDLEEYDQDYSALKISSDKWNYDKKHKVYWQVQLPYCTNPEANAYETMGIYVPSAYMDAKKNEDGTYICTVNREKEINGYTGETAPIVLPVNTEEYAAKEGPSEYHYKEMARYLKAGYIYVSAGMRGIENGTNEDGTSYAGKAPWGITDLKTAVRYYRYNKEVLPGDTDQIYSFGTAEGGGLAAILGASGDSDLYTPYLTEIGAAMHDEEGNEISDAIAGVMAWSPVTGLDYANEAYEWNVGQYSEEATREEGTWTRKFSEDLANVYGDYINALDLKDEEGNSLVLKKGKGGCFTEGSYMEYLLSVISESLNRFLSNTEFPYDGYDCAEDYIAALNEGEQWVEYDAASNTAKISSMKAFVQHVRPAAKSVGAFDDLNRTQLENRLFGTDKADALHFDSTMSFLLQEYSFDYSRLENWEEAIPDSYRADMEMKDSQGNSLGVRLSMYNPMYYVSPYYEGYKTSVPAKYWRISSGIAQTETAFTTENHLVLALKDAHGVEDVCYTAVWNQGQTAVEETGDAVSNFIEWVKECSGK